MDFWKEYGYSYVEPEESNVSTNFSNALLTKTFGTVAIIGSKGNTQYKSRFDWFTSAAGNN